MYKHMRQNNGSKFQIMKLLSWEWFLRQSLWPLDLLVSQAKAMVMSPFLPQVPWRVVETNVLPTQHTFQIKLQKTERCESSKEFVAKTLLNTDSIDVTLVCEMTNFNNLRNRPTMLATAFQVKVKSIDVTCVLSWSCSYFLGPLDTKEMTTLVFFQTFLLFQYR